MSGISVNSPDADGVPWEGAAREDGVRSEDREWFWISSSEDKASALPSLWSSWTLALPSAPTAVGLV